MSAEVSSFSKRAAAELSRCFNGLSTSVSSSRSSTSSTAAVLQQSTSRQQASSSVIASNSNQIADSNGTDKPLLSSNSSITPSSMVDDHQHNATIIIQHQQNNHHNKNKTSSMGTTQTLNNSSASCSSTSSGTKSPSQYSSSATITSQSDERSSSSSFGARLVLGGAFRVFKNSEKILLSPLKSSSNKSQQQSSQASESSMISSQQTSTNSNAAMTTMTTYQQQNHNVGSISSGSSIITKSNQQQQSAVLMTPSKQQQRRPSRNGPPPKAPPKTNRARRKNYLLNLQKPKRLEELFVNEEFLRENFFKHFPPVEMCRLSQVCKTWCHMLYSDSRYWRNLTYTIYYADLRQQEKQQQQMNGSISSNNNEDQSAKISLKLKDSKCHPNAYHNNGESSASINNNLFVKLNELNISGDDDFEQTMKNTKNHKLSSPDVFALLFSNDGKNMNDTTIRRQRLYHSIRLRSFDTICLQAASDTDLVELVNFYKTYSDSSATITDNIPKQPSCSWNLNHITICNGSITDQCLEILLTTFSPTLHSLELIGCNELTNSGLWSGLVPNLSLLTIEDCINISDDTVATLCQLLTSLRTFQFQAYHVTDIAMAYFSTSMMRQSLRVLTLQHCWEITNQGVANVAHSLPNLTSLSLSGCSKVTDDAIEVVAEQLRGLVVLDLSWCPRISDAALEYIACDLSDSLRTLVLDRCIHVTDIGLGYLTTMTNLENLSVRWCPQIRDFGLQALTSLRSLRSLSIAGCSHVTITGLSFITRMRQLEEIELTNCPAASKDLLKYLSESLPESCTIIT